MEFHSGNIMNINVIFPGDSGKMAGSWEDGVRISPMGKSMGKSWVPQERWCHEKKTSGSWYFFTGDKYGV